MSVKTELQPSFSVSPAWCVWLVGCLNAGFGADYLVKSIKMGQITWFSRKRGQITWICKAVGAEYLVSRIGRAEYLVSRIGGPEYLEKSEVRARVPRPNFCNSGPDYLVGTRLPGRGQKWARLPGRGQLGTRYYLRVFFSLSRCPPPCLGITTAPDGLRIF